MDPNPHKYDLIDPVLKASWEAEQSVIRKLIIEQDAFDWNVHNLRYVAGVDLSASKTHPELVCVTLVIYDCTTKQLAFAKNEIVRIKQPYIPGFLAFREVPPLYNLFSQFKHSNPACWPQLLIVDGNGILHQNMCGLACHLGVLLDLPTVGVGKTLFYIDGITKQTVKKQCEQKIHQEGDFALLSGDSGRVWGAALRNVKGATNPIFVSIGHRISLETAIKCVILLSEHRVVEPVRLADKLSRSLIEKADVNGDYNEYEMIYKQ